LVNEFCQNQNQIGEEVGGAGLPDGIFSYQKFNFWMAIEWKVLVHFMPI
jgi:hypothetical protein